MLDWLVANWTEILGFVTGAVCMATKRNALGVLELSWPLTRADVKSRYKELVKIHHPDANGGAREAEEKLKEINAAYSTLRSSEHLPGD